MGPMWHYYFNQIESIIKVSTKKSKYALFYKNKHAKGDRIMENEKIRE